MSDTAIRNALHRRKELASEIKRHEDAIKTAKEQLESVDRFISAWHDFADEEEREAIEGVAEIPASPSSGRRKNPRKEDVAKQARQIILERGHPMSRSDLFKSLADRGIVLHGKNPEVVLSTMLWRMKSEIVRLQPYGYWVADKPFEKAGYHPDEPYGPQNAKTREDSLI